MLASLQYRHVCEYAVGHGVAVESPTTIGGRVTTVTTTWLPRSEVRRVATSDALGDGLAVEQRMAALADVADGAAVRRALADLPTAYGRWIDEQRKTAIDPADRETLDELVKSAGDARRRIADCIELLATSDEARAAFALANRAAQPRDEHGPDGATAPRPARDAHAPRQRSRRQVGWHRRRRGRAIARGWRAGWPRALPA